MNIVDFVEMRLSETEDYSGRLIWGQVGYESDSWHMIEEKVDNCVEDDVGPIMLDVCMTIQRILDEKH